MKKILAIALVMMMLLATAACCTSCGKEKFIMGIDPEYDPFSYVGEDGNYTGFDVEVCQAVCDYLGWEMEIFAVDWDNKLTQLDAGDCDCVWSGMTILDSMKEAGYTLSSPYFESEQVLVVKSTSGYTKSADLAGKVVAVQLGTSGDDLLSDEESDLYAMAQTFSAIERRNSFATCFTELGGNAVDAVFVDAPVAAEYVANNDGYTIIDEDFGFEQYGIAFRSGDSEMCKKVEDALKALVENGTYKKIADKYSSLEDNLIFLK